MDAATPNSLFPELNLDPALAETVQTAPADQIVEGILRLEDPGDVPPLFSVVSRFNRICTGRFRAAHAWTIRRHPNVISFKAARPLGVSYDVEDLTAPDLPVEAELPPGTPAPFRGRGCIVAALDFGLDFGHHNFLNHDGTTRLLSFWHQGATYDAAHPNRYGYGRVFSREEINAALRASDPYHALGYHPAISDTGSGSHGTHTLDIAAGNGRAHGARAAAASNADLMFIHLSTPRLGFVGDLGDSVRMLEALDCVNRTAHDRPWVVNLSVGRTAGSHDGTSLVEQGMHELLRLGPGKAIVQSAGNYRSANLAVEGWLRDGEHRDLQWIIDPADTTDNEIDVWYSGKDRFVVALRPPHGSAFVEVKLGKMEDIVHEGAIVGRIYHRRNDPNNRDNHAEVFLYPGAPPGVWTVRLIGEYVISGRFHAWIERDLARPGAQSRFDARITSQSYTLGTIATSPLVITVGAYDANSEGTPLAPFSSCGPTRDERQDKPELLAPGVAVVAARSIPRHALRQEGLLVARSGTSMATPHVTGTVAAMFEAAGRPVFIDEIRECLKRSAEPVTNGEAADCWAWGRLDTARAIREIRGLQQTRMVSAALGDSFAPHLPVVTFGPAITDAVPGDFTSVWEEQETQVAEGARMNDEEALMNIDAAESFLDRAEHALLEFPVRELEDAPAETGGPSSAQSLVERRVPLAFFRLKFDEFVTDQKQALLTIRIHNNRVRVTFAKALADAHGLKPFEKDLGHLEADLPWLPNPDITIKDLNSTRVTADGIIVNESSTRKGKTIAVTLDVDFETKGTELELNNFGDVDLQQLSIHVELALIRAVSKGRGVIGFRPAVRVDVKATMNWGPDGTARNKVRSTIERRLNEALGEPKVHEAFSRALTRWLVGGEWEVRSLDLVGTDLVIGYIEPPRDEFVQVFPEKPQKPLTVGNLSKVDHIVVLMMENRSFDHMLGYLKVTGARPDVDGLTGKEENTFKGQTFRPFHLTDTVFDHDPCHDRDCVQAQVRNDTMAGFVASFAAKLKSGKTSPGEIMGYYDAKDLPVYDNLAREFVVCDRWFASHPGPTFPNRFYTMTGRLGVNQFGEPVFRNPDLVTYAPSQTKTIFDHLSDRRVTWHYYEHGYCFLRLFHRWVADSDQIRPSAEFFSAAASGKLPAVSFIDPDFIEVPPANDDHAPADVRDGQRLIGRIVNALMKGPAWPRTLLLITYDEHGGFFDHVVPPRTINVSGEDRYGVRVPAFVISPLVERGKVSHTEYDHTSILKTIIRRFCSANPPDLGPRVTAAADIGPLLSRARPRSDLPVIKIPVPSATAPKEAVDEEAILTDSTSLRSFQGLLTATRARYVGISSRAPSAIVTPAGGKSTRAPVAQESISPDDRAEHALRNSNVRRRESETSFLQRLLHELGSPGFAAGLSPADLFRAVLQNRPIMRDVREVLEVIAMPSQRPEGRLRPGDWMLRAVPGIGDVGHVSVLVSGDLRTPSSLASEGIAAESLQPGQYGLVIEAGAFPHSRSRPFARRLLDSLGRVLPHTLLLRPNYVPGRTISDFPPDDMEPERVHLADLAEDDPTPSPSVTLILDQPTEADDKFELIGGEGSFRQTLGASDAEALVAGEKVLRFKVKPDKKGYKLIHHRSAGSRRTVFLETRIQDMTEAGHGPQTAQYSYAQLDIQVPEKLPDRYGGSQNVDKDLVQASPVLVDLKVEDPEL